MALFLPGRTSCVICSKVVEGESAAVVFSNFAPNRSSELHRFSDAVAHEQCVSGDVVAQRALQVMSERAARSGPGNRTCEVCAEQIEDPNDYFSFGFVSDQTSSAGHWLNWLHLHRSHLGHWAHLSDAIESLESLVLNEDWNSDDLAPVLEELRNI